MRSKDEETARGRGDDPSSDVGRLIRERQVALVERQVSEAVAQGAQVLCGGHRPDLPGLKGFFYEPTVLARVNHTMRLMREETFGPVLPIMVVEDEAEAVALANDSDFGLSARSGPATRKTASVWRARLKRALSW